MRKIILPTAVLLLSFILIAVLPTEAEAGIYEDTLRLHILAASDSEEDQALKLKIRDRILEKYSKVLSDAENKDEAAEIARGLLPLIEEDAALWCRELGFDYRVRAEILETWYDRRDYEGFSLPCGVYTSLKIVIEDGEGQNWWCVMYPPMCLDVATGEYEDKYTDAEQGLISPSGYKIKFKLLELGSELCRKRR